MRLLGQFQLKIHLLPPASYLHLRSAPYAPFSSSSSVSNFPLTEFLELKECIFSIHPHTPPPSGAKAAILTPGKSSQGVVRGARHSLFFPSPSKEKVQPEAAVASGEGSSMVAVSEAVQTNAVTAVVQPVETDASSTSPLVAGTVLPAIVASYQTPAEIPEPIIGFKNKRVAGGGKGGNTLKKQK